MNYRQSLSKKTKKKILNTALKLFKNYGYNKTTVKLIMQEAQVSRSCFYIYFKNKDELLLEALFELDDKYEDFYKNELSASKNNSYNPLEKLEIFLKYVMRLVTVNGSEMTRMYYSYALKKPDVLTRENRLYNKIILSLAQEAREQGLLNDIYTNEEILENALFINRGIGIDWGLKNGSYPIEEKDSLFRKFCKAISS
ncbi:MAG: TetR/AcrR family transcriptional regulator [Synergistaceae bacterium]|nr:TetR/AcrR family transcriptional regulator [Synergistaceae bacterium]